MKSEAESANALNNYFCNVASKNNANLEAALQTVKRNQKTAFFHPASESEIINIINSIKASKSVGLDDLQISIFKHGSLQLAPIITHIINTSITAGIFPTTLKEVKIIPIYKEGNKDDGRNYRPIALIKSLGKIFDKFLHKRLYSFTVNYCNLISTNQHGFIKGRSTNTIISNLVFDILQALHDKEMYAFLSLDLSKAFDCVRHELLILKLEKLGIRGNLLDLFRSYLSDRQQKVYYMNVLSDLQTCKNGVPQGSSLGPLLYLLYINDLCDLTLENSLFAFADDTGLGGQITDLKKGLAVIQNSTNKVETWIEINGLSLNPDKTELIIFASHLYANYKEIQELTITVQEKKISPNKQIKYLGIILDDSLSWKPHILHLANSLRQLIPITSKLQKILPTRVLTMYYKSVIESRLLYNIDIWGSTHFTTLNNLQRVQNILARSLCGAPKQSSASTSFSNISSLNCFSLNIRSIYLNNWNKHFHCSNYFFPPLQLMSGCGSIATRGVTSSNYKVPKFYTDYGRFSIHTRLPLILNFLFSNNNILHLDWNGNLNKPQKKLLEETLQKLTIEDIKHLF